MVEQYQEFGPPIQFDWDRLKPQGKGFLRICDGFLLGVTGGGATWQFRKNADQRLVSKSNSTNKRIFMGITYPGFNPPTSAAYYLDAGGLYCSAVVIDGSRLVGYVRA